MTELRLSPPQLGLIAGTRGALGAGIGLLLGQRMAPRWRKTVGWALMAIGVASTVPLAVSVVRRARCEGADDRVTGATDESTERQDAVTV